MEDTTGKSIILRDKNGKVKEDLLEVRELRSKIGEIDLDQSKLIRLAVSELRKKLESAVIRKNKKQSAEQTA
jgi:hypothetical protein